MDDSEFEDSDVEQDPHEPQSAATTADLVRLPSCCPVLQYCRLITAEDASLAPMTQLETLKELSIDRFSNRSVSSLTALTQLQDSKVKISEHVIPPNTFALTTLRSLKYLLVDTTAVPQEELED